MYTGKEKHLHFLSPIPVPHQDHINRMLTSNNYTQDCIQIHNFQAHLPPTFLLSPPRYLYSLKHNILQIVTNSKYFRILKQLPIPLTSWYKSLFWVEEQHNLQHELHHLFNSDTSSSVPSDRLPGESRFKLQLFGLFICNTRQSGKAVEATEQD